jgi:hypothetical protein
MDGALTSRQTGGVSAGIGLLLAIGLLCPTVTIAAEGDARPFWRGGEYGLDTRLNLMERSTSEVLLAQAEGQPADAHPSETQTQEPEWELLPMLPLLKDKAAAAGIRLPLAFGVSVVGFRINRDIDVKSVSVGSSADQMVPVDQWISFDVGVQVDTITARVDTWVLPFLNVYGLYGNIKNESDVLFKVTVQNDVTGPVPNPTPPPPFTNGVILPAGTYTIPTQGQMDGSVYGLGVTLAGGYDRYFLTLDNNYTWANVGAAFDYTINTLMSTVRTGVRDQWGDREWRLWVGGTLWNTDRDLEGVLTAVDQGGTPRTLYFSVEQEPVTQQNFVVGGNIEYNRHLNFLLEYGFLRDVSVYLVGVNARF